MLYKIFLSSPADVDAERDVFQRVVEKINGDAGQSAPFELIRWEDQYYTADNTFQSQIVKPSECDIVCCIFWKRLGSDLPESYQRDDGTIPTGTEYEFEEALQGAEKSEEKLPDIIVYRKEKEVTFTESNFEIEKAQRDRFLHFWQRWFRNEKGHFIAAFHTFTDTGEFEVLVEGHLLLWLKNRSEDIVWTHGSPFRGLEPFDVQHAPIFFGRRREIDRARARLLTNCLSNERFMLIIGPTGSGKSSLVRAGLIPRLAKPGGLIGVARHLRWAFVTPSSIRTGWSSGLASALFADSALGAELREGDFDTSERLGSLLQREGSEAIIPIAKALDRASLRENNPVSSAAGETVALLLLIDQLEEIFAWPFDTAVAFIETLTTLVANQPQPILVVATMRSDFQHKLHELPILQNLVGTTEVRGPDQLERTLEISLSNPSDFREMFVGPSQAAGLSFEVSDRDLQQILENEAKPTALPAVQFLLTELYERRQEQMLTLQAFDALGGIGGVMGKRGEEVLAEVDEVTRTAFPLLVRALVTRTDAEAPATAQRVPEGNFQSDGAEARLILALTEARLLMSDKGQIRIAHESLIFGWDRLNQLIEKDRQLFESREHLLLYFRRFKVAANLSSAERKKLLLNGFPLAEGRELLDNWGAASLAHTEPELPAFINASIDREKWIKHRNFLAVLSIAAFFAVLTLVMYRFWIQAENAKRESDAARLVVESQRALRDGDIVSALDSGLKSYETLESEETRSAALTALLELSPNLEELLPINETAILTWLDNNRLALVSETGKFQIKNILQPLLAVLSSEEVEQESQTTISVERFSDDGLIMLFNEGLIAWLSTKGDEWKSEVVKLPTEPNVAAIHTTDNAALVAVAEYDEVLLFKCTLGAQPLACDNVLTVESEAEFMAIDESGRWLAIAGPGQNATGKVTIYDLFKIDEKKITDVATADINGQPIAVDWSMHDSLLAIGTRNGKLVILDASDMTKNTLPIFDQWSDSAERPVPVSILAWSPVTKALAFKCTALEICVYSFLNNGSNSEAAPLRIEHRFSGHSSTITHLSWSPHGSRLGSLSVDNKLAIWRIDQDSSVRAILKATSMLKVTEVVSFQSVAVDHKTKRIAAGDENGDVWLWTRLDSQAIPQHLAPEEDDYVGRAVVAISFAPDGALAVVYSDTGIGIWKADGTYERTEVLDGIVQRLAWSKDSQMVVVPRSDGTVTLIPRRGSPQNQLSMLKNHDPYGVIAAEAEAAVFVSYTDGSIRQLSLNDDPSPEIIVSAELAGKKALGAGSMSIDPTGRWLAATRNDDVIVLYDLQENLPPRRLTIQSKDTKTVAFAPDGNHFAALGSDGQLYVWGVGEDTTKRLLTVAATPSGSTADINSFGPRRAFWIAWWDDMTLLVATSRGEIQTLNFQETRWQSRARNFRK